MARRRFATLLLIGGSLVGLGTTSWCARSHRTPAPSGPATASGATRNDYSAPASWLCRPGRQDACAVDLTSTTVGADGRLVREPWNPHPDPQIDCFYVYPTVSRDPTPNSDMEPGPEERRAVAQQFARFGAQCRLFAPMYRQVSLTGLRDAFLGKRAADPLLAYGDVVDAWHHYLEHDNHGRGVVLIGHSQGARILTELLRNEIEGKPTEERIVSALLVGTNFLVPRGKATGGSLQHMPLCSSATQTGCIITFASFRASSPPPRNSRFGRTAAGGVVACTNPAALGGGSGELHAYFPARGTLVDEPYPYPWRHGLTVETPFVSVPGRLTAECASRDDATYLAVSVHVQRGDPRTADIPGDLVVNGRVLDDWGLHLVDMNLAMGNFVDVVGQQAKAYLARRK